MDLKQPNWLKPAQVSDFILLEQQDFSRRTLIKIPPIQE